MAGEQRQAVRRRARVPLPTPEVRRAPLLLFRFPAVLAALFAGALVLAASAAVSPLFLSSAGSVDVGERLQRVSPVQAGLAIQAFGSLAPGETGADELERRARAVGSVTGRIPGLGPALFTILGSQADATGAPGGQTERLQVVFRTGFQDHLAVVDGSRDGNGVWVDNVTADRLGLRPGSAVALSSGEHGVQARVSAVYRSLRSGPLPPFWADLEEFIRAPIQTFELDPPPFLLAPESEVRRLGAELGLTARTTWQLPLQERSPTLEEAESLAARFEGVRTRLTEGSDAPFGASAVTSRLPSIVDAAERTVEGIRAPVDVVGLAGRALALGMLVAGVAYETRRRRLELQLLHTLGAGPGHLGLAAALEVLVPFALAGAGGLVATEWLVDRFGPGGAVGEAARSSALGQVVWWLAIAVAAVGIAAAVEAHRSIEDPEGGRVRQVLGRAPWEALVLLLAGAALYEVLRGSAASGAEVDAFALLFPLLFVAGMAGLLARLAARFLPSLSALSPGRSTARYLAGRRLAGAASAELSLGATVVAAVALLMFGATVATSAAASLAEKARDAAGADVRVTVREDAEVPADLGFPHTEVWRIERASILPEGPPVTVLGVDPRTFGRAALRSGAFSGSGPDAALEPLRRGAGTRVPVVAVEADVAVGDLTLGVASRPLPATVVGTAGGFPGRTDTRAVFVAATPSLERGLARAGASLHRAGADRELWASGDPAAVLRALGRNHVDVVGPAITPGRVGGRAAGRSVDWAFGLFRALGAVAVVVALAALLLSLRAGRRAREVGYALATRMGLKRGTHLRALALELGAVLVSAALLGALLAWAAAWVVFRQLDLLPAVPPAASLHVPWATLAVVAAGLVVVTLLGAWVVQRGVDRANVAEVLRLAS